MYIQFIISSKQFQMKVNSANALMNELVKRYQISVPSAPRATPAKIERQISSKANQSTSLQVNNLRLRVLQLEEQNRNLKHTVQQQTGRLLQKEQHLTNVQRKMEECQQKYEQFKAESLKKTSYLENHNQALQQELLSIKQLLREQEALIIQLSSHQQND